MNLSKTYLNSMLLILCLGIGSGCQKNMDLNSNSNPADSSSSDRLFALNETESQTVITVKNSKGEELVGADVLIGMALNDPFPNNFLRTNANGQVIVAENQWKDQPVTINYPGYNRVTFFGVNPGQHTYVLRPEVYSGKYELKGKTTDFGKLTSRDDKADFGLVIQTLTRNDLFSFDLNMIISKEQDTLSVAGYSTRIPSNVTLPKQTENYFVDLTIEKSNYRTYFEMPGTKKIYALRGQFPFTKIVNEFRNNTPFQTLINHFNFTGASMRDIEITSNHQLDIPVNEITFGNPVKMKLAPSYAGILNQSTLIAMSASEKDGYIYPSDLKKFDNANGILNLKTSEMGSKYVVTALKRNEDFYAQKAKQAAISLALQPVLTPSTEVVIAPQLDYIAPPEGNLEGWMQNNPLAKLNGVTPLATYARLSRHQNFGSNVENVNVIWEAYAPIWVMGMRLPAWPKEGRASRSTFHNEEEGSFADDNLETKVATSEYHRWEVTFIGSNTLEPNNNGQPIVPLGPELANFATHITYNNKDF